MGIAGIGAFSYIEAMLPEQCRAARAFLNWSMDDLATRANCSNSTIRDYEAKRRTPHQNRLNGIRQALEEAGIVFSESNTMAAVAGPIVAAVAAEKPQRKPSGREARSDGNRRKIKRRAA